MLQIVFWSALFLVFFAYFGYPLTLVLVARLHRNSVNKAPYFPLVTLIITVYNEEKRIREKLENTVALDYPREKLQVLVASDGSTDNTNTIVSEYADHNIELLPVKVRGGKENAQKEAVEKSKGEILVFTDVATRLDHEGLMQIVANFADPSVGCVSSTDRVMDRDGRPGGEGAYVKYEMWLRNLESRVCSLVGLSGSFFAARKKICRDFSGDMQSDFRTLLNSMKMGLRGVSDPDAVGYYLDLGSSGQEFERKVRTVLRGITVFFRHPEFLNVFRYGFFSYQYFCHKLLRWLVPFFLAVAFLSNLFLVFDSWFYAIAFLSQLAFYSIATLGWSPKITTDHTLVKIPFYFLTVNTAILVAWWQYLRGNRMVMWTPSRR